MFKIESAYQAETKQKHSRLRLEFHVSDHCNLNCQMCDHFSPLAPERNLSVEAIRPDLARLSVLSEGKAEYIRILGGEPLLNPLISKFFPMVRACFPDACLELFTNGILLPKCPPSFWESCRANRIIIAVTRYPIAFDYLRLERIAAASQITFKYTNTQPIKKSWHFPLDLNGGQDPQESFQHCCHGNTCVFLKNGRLYPCPVAPNIEIFNRFFSLSLPLCETDGINIYSAQSIEEINAFLRHPIPFCKYCNVRARTKGYPWKSSEKSLKEWWI